MNLVIDTIREVAKQFVYEIRVEDWQYTIQRGEGGGTHNSQSLQGQGPWYVHKYWICMASQVE